MRSTTRWLGIYLLATMLALAIVPPVAAQDPSGWLEVRVVLLPLDDPGRFDLTVTDGLGNLVSHTGSLGDGGTTGLQPLPPGLYSVSEAGAEGTSLGIYLSDIECHDVANLELVVASCTHCTDLSDVPVASGSSVQCTVRNVNAQPPLAATIVQFEATCQEETPLLSWATEHEINVLGFNLYRGDTAAHPDVPINATLIPAVAPGSSLGAVYWWLDQDAPPAMPHAYWLEVLSLDGSANLLPPVAVACETPMAVRLAMFETQTSSTLSGLCRLGLPTVMLTLAGVLMLLWRRFWMRN